MDQPHHNHRIKLRTFDPIEYVSVLHCGNQSTKTNAYTKTAEMTIFYYSYSMLMYCNTLDIPES